MHNNPVKVLKKRKREIIKDNIDYKQHKTYPLGCKILIFADNSEATLDFLQVTLFARTKDRGRIVLKPIK